MPQFARLLCCVVSMLLPSVALAAESSLVDVCAKYSSYDRTGDGTLEIESLKPLAAESAEQPSGRMVLLVEHRLIDNDTDAKLQPALVQWAADLKSEGYAADVLAIDFAPSDVHRDGEYLLALREVLRELHRDHQLNGVVLVGRFPDAFLVRTCNWHRGGNITLHNKKPNQASYKKVRYVRRVPEPVARRCDIVLADLDGHWEDLYVQPKTAFESITAVFEGKIPAEGGEVLDVQTSSRSYEDCFHVADGSLTIEQPAEEGGKTIVRLGNETSNRECTPADRELPNVISHPEIVVSRVNAAGIAWSPREDIVGTAGEKLLDANGKPQAVAFDSKDKVPGWKNDVWQANPQMELELLVDYFQRNHAYRTGEATVAWRPSSISCDLPSGYRVMRRAADDWVPHTDKSLANVARRPKLDQFAEWINYPAILRTVRAHTFPQGSQFRRGNVGELDEMLAGNIWSWTPRGNRLEPSLSSACGRGMLNWFLLRSLWENDQVAEEPAFYHHTGCDSVSPYGASKLPFTHRDYGRYQSAEALLLMGNGLALVGRAKVYYDEPRGFVESLGRGETFGTAWSDYFAYESGAKGKPHMGEIGRKRSYFWNVLGDATLVLKRPENEEVEVAQAGDTISPR